MVERGANIDLVFRNGLKDYEVLPPPEVWGNIKPAVKVKTRPVIFVRAAAVITIFLLMSFLASRWGRVISTIPDNSDLAFEIESVTPVIYPIVTPASVTPGRVNIPVNSLQNSIIAGILEPANLAEREDSSSPDALNVPATNNLTLSKTFSGFEPVLASLYIPLKKSFDISPVIPMYIEESSAPRNTERWSIGAMASPTYYSSFSTGKSELSNQLAASEKSLLSYSGGVAVSYKLNKRFSIQTGLYYSSLGQEVDGINSFGGFQRYDYTKGDHNFAVLTTNGTVYTNNADVFLTAPGQGERILTAYTNDVFDPNKANLQYISNSLIQNFSFLELPVVLRYKIIDKVVDINLIGGMSYNMMVNNSVYTMANGGKYSIGKTEGINLLTLSSSFGMGMEYSFSKKLSLNLEPTFRYYLNRFNVVTGSTNHPYSFGVFSGISYKF
jgi:hypothetical protein